MDSFIKNPNILLKLCSFLIFYTYYSYSTDDNKCPTIFKYDFEKGDIVLREDTPSNNQYGGTYRAGISITTTMNIEQKLSVKFRNGDSSILATLLWDSASGYREDLKDSDIQDHIYKKEKFYYEFNEGKYVLSQDTPSVYYGSDKYFYRKGTPINKMHRLDRELFLDVYREILSRDIQIPMMESAFYRKGASAKAMEANEKKLDAKFPRRWQ